MKKSLHAANIALAATAALLFSGPTLANSCAVVTDAANDSLPNTDIVGINMGTSGATLEVEFEMAADQSQFSGLAWVHAFMSYANGEQYFVEADLTFPGEVAIYLGTWEDSGFGGYSLSYLNDGSAIGDGSISGTTVSISAPLDMLGSPSGEMSVFGASKEGLTGVSFVPPAPGAPNAYLIGAALDTTDAGTYTVGDACAKAEDYYGAHYAANQDLKNSQAAPQAAAGSLGGLMLLTALAGLRRRRSR